MHEGLIVVIFTVRVVDAIGYEDDLIESIASVCGRKINLVKNRSCKQLEILAIFCLCHFFGALPWFMHMVL